MKVDFHCHSTASDGTFAPRELAAAACGGGFGAIALTDHDNTDGAVEFLGAGEPGGCRLLAGVELSIEPGEGFDRFHLLGIGIDPLAPALRSLLAKVLEGRKERNAKIIENFRRLGFDMAETIGGYSNGEVLARPHFARWLVDRGHVASVKEGFARYLASDSPPETRCYERRWRPAQEEAFAAIHASGGICVMAHPKYWRDEWKLAGPDYAMAARELSRLKEAGLDALEAKYQANEPSEDVEFTRLADSLGLLKSAGSDFHGGNKPAITLGMDVSDSFIAPLFARLGLAPVSRPGRS